MKHLWTMMVALLGFVAAGNANAAETALQARYAVYAGGFHVLGIDAVYDISEGRYRADMDMQTTGMLGRLAPWSGRLLSQGLIPAGAPFRPLEHSFTSVWRGEAETSALTFDAGGKPLTRTRQKRDEPSEVETPDAAIFGGGAVDILTAIMQAGRGETCAGKQAAFDGKRRFDMVFRPAGTEELSPGRYSAFEGRAESCTVEIIPVAGPWRDKKRGWMSIQEQAKTQGTLPRIWFGKVRDGYPAIPVRVSITTDYGTMIMHLESVQ